MKNYKSAVRFCKENGYSLDNYFRLREEKDKERIVIKEWLKINFNQIPINYIKLKLNPYTNHKNFTLVFEETSLINSLALDFFIQNKDYFNIRNYGYRFIITKVIQKNEFSKFEKMVNDLKVFLEKNKNNFLV